MRRLPAGPAAARLDGLVLLLVAVTAAGGLGLLVGGARPRELLHFVYAVVALAALPISTSVSARWEPRRRGMATVIGALVGLAVIVRLFGTG
ncbi:MAG TPA: hypothetical protein VIN32_05645 [Candidatus Limnocylindria bacterium]